MGFINLAEKKIHAKLVYYGIGAGGKTTSLQAVHGIMCPSNEVKLVSINTEQDATLLFDFLPINLGTVEGYQIIIQGFTVPGQPKYRRMRKYVLQGADAVVLVVDSQRSRIEENLEALDSLTENLSLNGLDFDSMPIVVQYNKRDLDDILTEEELNPHFLTREGIQAFPSVATEGQGVYEAFVFAVGQLIETKIRQYNLGRGEIDANSVSDGAKTRLWSIFDQYRSQEDGVKKNEVLEFTVQEEPVGQDSIRADEAPKIDLKGERLGLDEPDRHDPGLGLRGGELDLRVMDPGEDDPFDLQPGVSEVEVGEDDVAAKDDELHEPSMDGDSAADDSQPADSVDESVARKPVRKPSKRGGKRRDKRSRSKSKRSVDAQPDAVQSDITEPDSTGEETSQVVEPTAATPDDQAEVLSASDELFSDADLDIELTRAADAIGETPPLLGDGEGGLLDMALQSNLELAKAFGELDQFKAALRRKNDELIKIVQNTIHDLNKPLSAIKLMLMSAVKGYLGELNGNLGAGIDNALAAVSMMERLIGDLMDSMVLDTSFKMKFGDVDMAILITDVIRTLRYNIEDLDVGVRVEPMPVIRADEWALTKAFMNLIGNAIEYRSPDRVPRIRISYEDRDDYHGFTVADNGIGIPDGQGEKLFLRFERGTNVGSTSGTGLGLHIVKEAVMGHGGMIRLQSRVGEGTTFHIQLPKEPVEVPQSPVSKTVEL